jgi:hypothetical protein
MLGLDRHVIEFGDEETFELIKRRRRTFGTLGACAADLKHDPNNPVWESYCPNTGVCNALLKARWLVQIDTFRKISTCFW